MREKDFENKVKDHLRNKGAWFVKTWSNGIQREGIPDILACVNGYFVGIEVKAEKGHPSALQLWHIRKIREAGGIAFVLYPEQYEFFVNVINFLLEDDDPIYPYVGFEPFDERLTTNERRILYGAGQQEVCD